MNRKNIRQYAAVELGLKTGKYQFVSTLGALKNAASVVGYPCVIKPVMSSSGHGQSIARTPDDIEKSWVLAKEARGDASELIVEEFIKFDYEITLLTIRNGKETVFCEPIGHEQRDGDYVFSWQPAQMSELAKQRAQEMAKTITDGLGGRGIFGVELFVKGDEVYTKLKYESGIHRVQRVPETESQGRVHTSAVSVAIIIEVDDIDIDIKQITYETISKPKKEIKQTPATPLYVKVEIKDDDLKIEKATNAFYKKTSYSSTDIIGKKISDILVVSDINKYFNNKFYFFIN